MKNATADKSLFLYSELQPAAVRAVQRRVQKGELQRIVPGVVTSHPAADWPSLIARERNRVLAALFPGAVIGYRGAFNGGLPDNGRIYLNYSYDRRIELPGLTVILVKASGKAPGDMPIGGKELYFASYPRLLLENLTISRGPNAKAVGPKAVEERLLTVCEARGELELVRLREDARALAPTLRLEREVAILDSLIGSILRTRQQSSLQTPAGKAWASGLPFDAARVQLFDRLAAALRATPLAQPEAVARSTRALENFAFLESYFSNFIEGTEFEIQEARDVVLAGKPVATRPKDSHDIIGVFRQASDRGWANQTLASGEAVLEQLRARHSDLMKERPEINPGEFKDRENYAGNTGFVSPRFVRGTLVQASEQLGSVPAGTARALYAMFIVSEVHPFNDGNGRIARLVMNSELSVVSACRIIVPTLFRQEYLDCLRVLTREADPGPYLKAMQHIHAWTASFDYEDLDQAIVQMHACNAFERSRAQHQLRFPKDPKRSEAEPVLRTNA